MCGGCACNRGLSLRASQATAVCGRDCAVCHGGCNRGQAACVTWAVAACYKGCNKGRNTSGESLQRIACVDTIPLSYRYMSARMAHFVEVPVNCRCITVALPPRLQRVAHVVTLPPHDRYVTVTPAACSLCRRSATPRPARQEPRALWCAACGLSPVVRW